MADESPRQVNNILRTMRGEQFRHSRNVQRMPANVPLSFHTHNRPTLPVNLIHPPQGSEENTRRQIPSARGMWLAGPNPPRSWSSSLLTKAARVAPDNLDTPQWREEALSVVLSPEFSSPSSTAPAALYGTPPLTLLCLRVLLAAYRGPEFTEVAPYIPPHLRRDLLRDSAICSPLSQTEIHALCYDGHVDGELIVIGPHASLRVNHFQTALSRSPDGGKVEVYPHDDSKCADEAEEETSWDSIPSQEKQDPPLHMLTLVSTPLAIPTFLVLPPTITQLALLNIPSPVPLHRLPTICPLLTLVDVSYNSWLSPARSGDKILEEVGWSRLRHLKVLGLRECQVTLKVVAAVNKGRWDDVQIVT
ncbi:hypothetical protein BV22DRAFT_1002214 [Leucogyrophana mollusca]|uniref:Uncharacterized protein n=1 Tax=Leucogyrophana mollusca TaxID=85980 RepID=A0ACB8BXW3_9AGAM|nr:hypothetical protein BV22DRAFT_1002214 [Leucogyrophana mollusca]